MVSSAKRLSQRKPSSPSSGENKSSPQKQGSKAPAKRSKTGASAERRPNTDSAEASKAEKAQRHQKAHGMLVAPMPVPSVGLLPATAGALGATLFGSSSQTSKSAAKDENQSAATITAPLPEERPEIAKSDFYRADEFNRVVSLHDEYRRAPTVFKRRVAWQNWIDSLERHLDVYAPKGFNQNDASPKMSMGTTHKAMDNLFAELKHKVSLYDSRKLGLESLNDTLREMQERIYTYRMMFPPSAERVNQMQKSLGDEYEKGTFPDWSLIMKELELSDAMNRFNGVYNQQAAQQFSEIKELLNTGASFERLIHARGRYQNAISDSWFKG